MAVFSISAGANGFEISSGGVNYGSEVDCAQFRAAEAKTGLGSTFQKAHDFAEVSKDMGVGGNIPKVDNSFRM